MNTQIEKILELSRTDSPEGLAAFYAIVHNQPPPVHAVEWMRTLYRARAEDKPYLLEAFRGSTKTTTVLTFGAHQLGLAPTGSGLIVRSNDPKATEAADFIADIISNNPGWRIIFPDVIPDVGKGWSAAGYEIKRADLPYETWRRMNSDRLDPSFGGLSYNAKAMVGWHPRLWLIIDDLHDEDNTSSDRLLADVKKKFAGTILPTRRPNNPFLILSGTPWTRTDVLADCKKTGQYVCDFTPVEIDGKPVWPNGMNEKAIEQERKLDITGGPEFARMYMLDLEASERRVFSYQLYPAGQISSVWPMTGGVDYAGVLDPTRGHPDASHYALAYVAKLPIGGAVVYDGVLEQWTQAEGEESVLTAQKMFPSWTNAVVEGDGKGEEFIAVLLRHPGLRIIPMKTGGKSKAERLVKQMGPYLRTGRVRISDGNSKFLNALRNFFNAYPNVERHDPGWDAADAVYWALRGMPDVLAMPEPQDDGIIHFPWEKSKVKENPFKFSEQRV